MFDCGAAGALTNCEGTLEGIGALGCKGGGSTATSLTDPFGFGLRGGMTIGNNGAAGPWEGAGIVKIAGP